MGRRVKILRVSRAMLADLFRQDATRQLIIMDGLPADARLVAISETAYFDSDDVALKFESAEWPEAEQYVETFRVDVTTVNLEAIVNAALRGVYL